MSLFTELKRRNVLRVAAAYVAVAWLVIQVVETLFPVFGLGHVAIRAVVILLAVGFLPAVISAWAFELTPQGFKREADVDHDSPVSRRMTRRLDRFFLVALALAVGYFAFDKFVLDPARDEAFRQAMLGQAQERDTTGSRLGEDALVTDFAGSHTQPALSPNGGRMAFVSPDENGVQQIWGMGLPEGRPVQITRGELPSILPSWSPAGDSILFQSASAEHGQSIWLVDALGSQAPRLVVAGGSSPSFAPDGRSFVFHGMGGIAVGFVDGSPSRPLEGIPERAGFAPPMPAINAAGDIVFVLADAGPIGDLWVYEAGSGEFRQLTRSTDGWPGVDASWPIWMPDGRNVIYAAPDGDGANVHLWQIDTVTGETSKLTAGPGGYGYPALSGDGSRLAYAHARPIWRIVATDPGTAKDRVIYESRKAIALPLVSPDGSSVVFFGEDGVFTVAVDGGRAEQRTFGPPAEATLPFWSRSNRSIYYYKGRSLHRLVPETGLSEPVLEDFHWTTSNWAAVHGDRLAYHLRKSRRTVIHDLASEEKRFLDERVLPTDWSRDGKRLLARGSESAVVICTAPHFGCEPIRDESGSVLQGAMPRWSMDESRVFFRRARQDKPGHAEIWSAPWEGGEVRVEAEVGPFDGTSMYFGIAEGDVIVWNEFDPAGVSEIWMADATGIR